MRPFDRLGHEIAKAQEAPLSDLRALQEARARLLRDEPTRRSLRRLWTGIAVAFGLASMDVGVLIFKLASGLIRSPTEAPVSPLEVVMHGVLIAVVVAISLSFVVERSPGGTLRFTRTFGLLREFIEFIRERKLWWMTPVMVIMTLLGTFIILTEHSIVLPFIYAVF